MPTLDRILEPLKDGKWHTLREINKEVELPQDNLAEIMGFFAEYKFVQLDKKRGRARLTSSMLEFFTKTQQMNQEG